MCVLGPDLMLFKYNTTSNTGSQSAKAKSDFKFELIQSFWLSACVNETHLAANLFPNVPPYLSLGVTSTNHIYVANLMPTVSNEWFKLDMDQTKPSTRQSNKQR